MKKVGILLLLIVVLSCLTGCEKKASPVTQNAKEMQESLAKEETVADPDSVLSVVETEQSIGEYNIIRKEDVVLSNESEVFAYFQRIEDEVDHEIQQPLTSKVTRTLKNTFITTVDFLFYGGTIKGVTFDSLTERTKLEILHIADSIDAKVESKLPGYKEHIQTTTGRVYRTAKSMIQEAISHLDDSYHQKVGEDIYQETKDSVDSLKDNFQNGYSKVKEVVKEVGGTVKDKVKEWYENFRK